MRKSKIIALCAIFSAMGTVIMFVGSATNVLDISCAGIASLLVLLANIEIGGVYPFLIYAVTSLLSVLILPDKFGAIVFMLIVGWYPMLKRIVESKLPRVTGWIVKIVVFSIALALIILTARFILGDSELNTLPLIIATAAVSELTFILFDIALTRLISLYFFKYRSRVRKLFK